MNDPWREAPLTRHRWYDIREARETYRTHGIAVVPEFVTGSNAAMYGGEAIMDRLLWSRVASDARPATLASDGGRYAAWLADTALVAREHPVIYALYDPARILAETITGRPVIFSPYPKSAITIKVYGPDDCQDLHRDSNPLSALLLLTGGPPRFEDPIKRNIAETARPGSLLVFAGREAWHKVEPVVEEWKATVCYNLYHPEDMWRPDGQDEVVYG